jgi:hypothetical protein
MAKEIAERITVDPAVMVGKPGGKGTRMPVELVLAKLLTERGHDATRIAREYLAGLPDDEVLAIAHREQRLFRASDTGGGFRLEGPRRSLGAGRGRRRARRCGSETPSVPPSGPLPEFATSIASGEGRPRTTTGWGCPPPADPTVGTLHLK